MKKFDAIAFPCVCILFCMCFGITWFNGVGIATTLAGYDLRSLMLNTAWAILLILTVVLPPLAMTVALWRRYRFARWVAIAEFTFFLGFLTAAPVLDTPFYSQSQIILNRCIIAIPVISAAAYLFWRREMRPPGSIRSDS